MFTKKSEKRKFNITFHSLIVLFYFLYCCIPAVQFQVDAKGSYIILILILPYIAYYSFVRGYLNKDRVIIFALLTLSVGMMYWLLTSHLNTPHPILSYVIMFSKMLFPLAMFLVICRKNNRGEMNFVFLGMTVIFIYLLYHTITNSVDNANVVYEITNMNYENFDNTAIAMSMDQNYALVPIFCMLLPLLLGESKMLVRVIAGIGMIAIVVALLVAQFTIAALVSFVSVMIYITKRSKGYWKVVPFFLMVLVIFALPSLLTTVANHVESENMAIRLTEVAQFLRTGEMTGYNLSTRVELYTMGIAAFLKSPLWGNYELGFNPHSSFIQFAADLGILGLLIFIYVLRYSKKRIAYELKENSLGFTLAYSALVIVGMVNPIAAFPTMFLVVFCYVPMGQLLLSGKPMNRREQHERLED